MSMSLLDSQQCIKTAFDDATGTLKVSQTGEFEMDIRASDGDSVLAVGTTDGTVSGTQKVIKVNASGDVQVDVISSALPTGAATSAKQPALGTAGTASADVITVQGIASMTPMIVRPVGYSARHISTNTTTTAKSGSGLLHSITINTSGASSNTITVYDNTVGSGTVLAVIDGDVSPTTLYYDVAFATGLTLVTATGTSADITVSYL
jgi:hypothetical protein